MLCHSYHKVQGLFKSHSMSSPSSAWESADIAKNYLFPAPLPVARPNDGIALIELGGGFLDSDVIQHFGKRNLPVPPVTFISIMGAKNAPDGADGAQGEVMLDIVAAGGVTGGKIPLFVPTAPNTTAGFVAAIQWAANDPRISTISISWGQAEDRWSLPDLTSMESAFALARSKRKSVTAASGDNGSSDGLTGDHVDYPSASPQVLGCGGTTLPKNGVETVWNNGIFGGATGGGVSVRFPTPSFQPRTNIPGTGRGVPDVAGVADSQTGWIVTINGQETVIGGTSAVAPMWAGLLAIYNQLIAGGFYDWTKFYTLTQGFRDIIQGNNGTYIARKGYDCCTGLGSPDGTLLLQAIGGAPVTPPPIIPPPTPPPGTPPAPPNPVPAIGNLVLHGNAPAGTFIMLDSGNLISGNLTSPLPAGKYDISK